MSVTTSPAHGWNVKPGQLWQHYKNKNIYVVEQLCKHSDSDTVDVVFRDVNAPAESLSWRRPLSEWEAKVHVVGSEFADVPRFVLWFEEPKALALFKTFWTIMRESVLGFVAAKKTVDAENGNKTSTLKA